MVSSSTSVGSRPSWRKWAWIVCISTSERKSWPSRLSRSSASSSIVADRHGDQLELVRRADLELLERQRADDHLLDGVVGQHLRAEQGQPVVRQGADGSIFRACGRPRPGCRNRRWPPWRFGPPGPSRPAWAGRGSKFRHKAATGGRAFSASGNSINRGSLAGATTVRSTTAVGQQLGGDALDRRRGPSRPGSDSPGRRPRPASRRCAIRRPRRPRRGRPGRAAPRRDRCQLPKAL